jgi:hypothetical protein
VAARYLQMCCQLCFANKGATINQSRRNLVAFKFGSLARVLREGTHVLVTRWIILYVLGYCLLLLKHNGRRIVCPRGIESSRKGLIVIPCLLTQQTDLDACNLPAYDRLAIECPCNRGEARYFWGVSPI